MRVLPPENLLFVKTEALEKNASEARLRCFALRPREVLPAPAFPPASLFPFIAALKQPSQLLPSGGH